MKKTSLSLTLLGLLFALCAHSAMAQLTQAQRPNIPSNGNSLLAPATPAKRIAPLISSDTSEGARVKITSDMPLNDYSAYRSNDLFYVVIPQAEIPQGQSPVSGVGFADAKMERQGDDLILSFRLKQGVTASVNQKFNRLEVIFVSSESASAAVKNSVEDVAPASTEQRTSKQKRTRRAAANHSTPSLQDPLEGFQKGNDISLADIDLTVPESPAFTVLGVTPETVVRPTTPREFASSLLNGLDQNGNFQTGVAFDAVPFLVFFGNDTNLYDYKRSAMTRFLSRTQLSFATAKGVTDDDKSTRLALGLRMTLWDSGDPRLDRALQTCYKDETDKLFAAGGDFDDPIPLDPTERDEEISRREKIFADKTEPCDDTARKRNWNASSWIVGLAPSWISETGSTSNFRWNGGGFWTSVAYGFEQVQALKDNSQLIFHARYRNNEIVPDADTEGLFFSQDSLYFGSRLRVSPGKKASSILSFEGVFLRSRRDNNEYDNSSRYSLGLEQRLANNIWFALSLGGHSGREDGTNQTFVTTSFKWGFSKKESTTEQ